LGVFRRQLSTVDPDVSEPTTPLIEAEEDYDDIDKVRDDLQSTKQLLEIELKNRSGFQAEKLQLLQEIRKLKQDLQVHKSSAGSADATEPAARRPSYDNHNLTATPYAHATGDPHKNSASRVLTALGKSMSITTIGEKDGSSSSSEEEDYGELDAVEEELNALRGQAELARKTAAEFERLYKETAAKLVTTQAEMEDMEHKAVLLQKKLRRAQGPGAKDLPDITNLGVQTDPVELPPPADYHRPLRSLSKRDVRKQMARQDSHISSVSVGEDGEEEDEDDEDDEPVDDELRTQKRELAMLQSRLRSTKDKERNTRNERIALRLQLRKFRSDLKDEHKRYAKLKKEVDGMALMMSEAAEEDAELVVEEVEVTDSEDEDDEDADQEDDDEDQDEDLDDDIEEVEEVESEGRDSDSDELSDRLVQLTERVHNHDHVLGVLKKGNYLLKSRVDSQQEELRKARNVYFSLELELNTCLAELG